MTFPPEDLECPDPENCPVSVSKVEDLLATGNVPTVRVSTSRPWFRIYDAQDGFAQPNPGYGDTRFAPFNSALNGERVPFLYLAESLEAALLETALHDVGLAKERVVHEMILFGMHHAQVEPPEDLLLADFRNQQLKRLGFERSMIASSASEHYACTRRIAKALHAASHDVAGIVWHSRQAEMVGEPDVEVAVIFADRIDTKRGSWTLSYERSASGALLEGAGRLLLDELAERLEVTVINEDF